MKKIETKNDGLRRPLHRGDKAIFGEKYKSTIGVVRGFTTPSVLYVFLWAPGEWRGSEYVSLTPRVYEVIKQHTRDADTVIKLDAGMVHMMEDIELRDKLFQVQAAVLMGEYD